MFVCRFYGEFRHLDKSIGFFLDKFLGSPRVLNEQDLVALPP